MKISICIPTYNRSVNLNNCLYSIYKNRKYLDNVEVCILDNCSTDNTRKVVNGFKNKININYKKNIRNLGMAYNIINVTKIAKGEFIWIIGDDDVLMDDSIFRLKKMIKRKKNIDFFYVNAFSVKSGKLKKIKNRRLNKFGNVKKDEVVNFLDLINPNLSFDFLGGIFLSVFRRSLWINNVNKIPKKELLRQKFSSLETTFPHVVIFSYSFINSKAFINSNPIIYCSNDVRDWLELYPLIKNFRLLEVLFLFKKKGLSNLLFHTYVNKTLNNFIPDLVYILLDKKKRGWRLIKKKQIIFNFLYPNSYLSPIYFLIRKIKKIL
jgi:glycosyltransferase involved in cell wall biosynthesis